jgi:hypothetical protein
MIIFSVNYIHLSRSGNMASSKSEICPINLARQKIGDRVIYPLQPFFLGLSCLVCSHEPLKCDLQIL